jgi:hypothetical protein
MANGYGEPSAISHDKLLHWRPGRSVSFCTRQFKSSPTNSSFSLRQSMALIVPNSLGSRSRTPDVDGL